MRYNRIRSFIRCKRALPSVAGGPGSGAADRLSHRDLHPCRMRKLLRRCRLRRNLSGKRSNGGKLGVQGAAEGLREAMHSSQSRPS